MTEQEMRDESARSVDMALSEAIIEGHVVYDPSRKKLLLVGLHLGTRSRFPTIRAVQLKRLKTNHA